MLCRLNCSVLLSLLLVSVSYADIFLPDGLSPGDKYRIVFVTSGTRDATSSNINDYNTHVNTAANAVGAVTAPLNQTDWKAIGSTASINALVNTGTNSVGVPIYLVDGTSLVASDNADLWDGELLSTIDLDEFGMTISSFVWTGTSSDGTGGGLRFYHKL